MRSLTVLTLTDNAATEIRNLTHDPEVPGGCGVRIATDPAGGGLSLALAATPAEDDQVLEEGGARVFLEPEAAVLLDDKALDAGIDDAGQVRFSIAESG
jgi:iron-sulfur cluster assembly protein